MKTALISLIALLSLSVFASGGAGDPNEEIPKVTVDFGVQTFDYQGEKYLALNYKNHPKWHTYWKNPGDAGLPIKNTFKVNDQEVKLKELEWPVPKKYIEQGDILAYGYENSYTLFYKFPKDQLGEEMLIESKWLVCKHICIPGEDRARVKLTNEFTAKLTFEKPELEKSFKDLPKVIPTPVDLDLILASDGNKDTPGLILFYTLSNTKEDALLPSMNILTPFPVDPFAFKRESVYKDKKSNLYAKFNIEWDGEYVEPEIPFPSNGKFDRPYKLRFLYADPATQKVSIIEKSFKSISLDKASQTESFFSLVTKLDRDKPTNYGSGPTIAERGSKVAPKQESGTLLYYIIFAFIGGFILNFMPCVLPVISLKLFGLIKHKGESRLKVLTHNFFYSLGIISTFFLLAGIIIGLKSAGTFVGWGFQLQSPGFVAAMTLVIFVMGLNLFGLFEFKTPGGSKLGGVEVRNTYSGDFMSGVLATILSTPCSAPFLGTALTFAFSSGALTIFVIFGAIGIGLATPFILTGLFPALIAFLPRPGAWMEHMKKFLGLTLILTTVWLIDVYTALVSSSLSVIKLNTALVMIFFAFYMQKHITKKKQFLVPFFIIAFTLFANVLMTKNVQVETNGNVSQMVIDKNQGELKWEAWSEKRMNELQDQKKITFVDFTAKWCFTCKVNEKLVIDTASFESLVKERGVKLLLADWTKRDEMIGNWLKKNGMVGVPAYFIINSKGELLNLGETLSINELKEKLN